MDPKVIALFQQYSWPGNVRELERVLEYAFVFVKGAVITKSHLPELELHPGPSARRGDPDLPREDERAAHPESPAKGPGDGGKWRPASWASAAVPSGAR